MYFTNTCISLAIQNYVHYGDSNIRDLKEVVVFKKIVMNDHIDCMRIIRRTRVPYMQYTVVFPTLEDPYLVGARMAGIELRCESGEPGAIGIGNKR